MSPTTLPHTIRSYSSGALATGFFGAFLALILFAGAQFLISATPLPGIVVWGGCAAAWVVALSALYFFFSTEVVAVVDATGLKVTQQSRVGPIRGKSDLFVEVRWDKLPYAYDVTRTTITKHGNTQTSYHLLLDKKPFEGALLGTMGRDGRYLELLEAVRLAIGDRLVARDDLGELGEAMERRVQQGQKKQKGSDVGRVE